jgi:uncharacterized membrane protein YphA (DoxX/SURF4 family)
MKKTNIIYWIVTGLFGAFMLFTAFPNVTMDPESVKFLGQLGYPKYFVPFIGIAKVGGVLAILIPGFPRIKEWAYAGLVFDLVGANYSVIAVWGLAPSIIFMLLPLAFAFASYFLYHKRLRLMAATA